MDPYLPETGLARPAAPKRKKEGHHHWGHLVLLLLLFTGCFSSFLQITCTRMRIVLSALGVPLPGQHYWGQAISGQALPPLTPINVLH